MNRSDCWFPSDAVSGPRAIRWVSSEHCRAPCGSPSAHWTWIRSGESCESKPASIFRARSSSGSIGCPMGTRCSPSRSRARSFERTSVRNRESHCPVPEDLQQLLSARLAALPSSARSPLLAISALSQPTVELVLAAATAEDAPDGLARAEAMGIVERSDGRVRFSHPLFGSTVYVNASRARVATCTFAGHAGRRPGRTSPTPRARGRRADAEVARALDEAARLSRARGAPDAAADLAELARR